MLHRLEEQLVAVPLARALNRKDEVVSPPAEFHLALKFGMSQRLSADGVLHRILDHGLYLAQVALVAAAGLADVLPRDCFEANDALGEALLELFGVGAQDGPGDVDERQETVGGGGDGRELGVVCADALVHVHGQVDGLLGPQLGDEDVWVDGPDGVLAAKVLGLPARRHKDNVLCVDVRVVVRLERVVFRRRGVLVDGACDVELEAHRVPVEAVCVLVLAGGRLLVPFQKVVDALAAAVEGHEAQSVGEHLILDDGGVVLYEDVFDGEGWDLGDEDAAEGVCERGVDADEGEGGVVGLVAVELDGKGGLEVLDGKGVVFAGEVAGEICGGDVGDCLFVDADGLEKKRFILLATTHRMKS